MQNKRVVIMAELLEKERFTRQQFHAKLSAPSGVSNPAYGADSNGGVTNLAGESASSADLVGVGATDSSGATGVGGGPTSACVATSGTTALVLTIAQASGGSTSANASAAAPPVSGTASGQGGRSVHYAQEEKKKKGKREENNTLLRKARRGARQVQRRTMTRRVRLHPLPVPLRRPRRKGAKPRRLLTVRAQTSRQAISVRSRLSQVHCQAS